MKLKLTSQQNDLFETVALNANKKYYFFPNIYVKTDNNEFKEVKISEIPEGIQKYIENRIKELANSK